MKSTVVVAHGHEIKIRLQNAHLTISDGFGQQRRTRRYHRTAKVRRIVIIGRSGYISLDALKWITDTGAALIHIDPAGRLTTTSQAHGPDLAALRRAQALARDRAVGIDIAQHVLTLKVQGQHELLSERPSEVGRVDHIATMLARIDQADTLPAIITAEASAAEHYWKAWAGLPIRLGGRGARDVPDHWRTFGQRASLLTGGPRLATNPANAILNYLYALLEAETILACHAVGLDPGIGIFHTDQRDRASLALDLMEAIRPTVDAHVLALLTTRTLSARDFAETREGACRIVPSCAATFAGTCERWRAHIAPVVEGVAHMLAADAAGHVPTLTPLTGANRQQARWPEQRPPDRLRAFSSDIPNTCRDCGVLLPNRRVCYCEHHRQQRFNNAKQAGRARAADTLAQLRSDQQDPAHGGNAGRLRGQKNAAHQQAVRAWTGERPEPGVFTAEIAPGLTTVPIGELTAATGLSAHYCSLIRLGKRVPHARHWEALREIAVRSNASGGSDVS